MKALKIPFFASGDNIIKLAKKKHNKHKKFTFARWPDNTVRLIIMNGTCGSDDPEDFNAD